MATLSDVQAAQANEAANINVLAGAVQSLTIRVGNLPGAASAADLDGFVSNANANSTALSTVISSVNALP